MNWKTFYGEVWKFYDTIKKHIKYKVYLKVNNIYIDQNYIKIQQNIVLI